MEKMNLPLKQFLTLIGPSQKIKVISEDEEVLFEGKNVRIRDNEELHNREVKHIQPAEIGSKKLYFEIWIY